MIYHHSNKSVVVGGVDTLPRTLVLTVINLSICLQFECSFQGWFYTCVIKNWNSFTFYKKDHGLR